MMISSQKDLELDRLAHRLQVVRELIRERQLGVWARDHWKTVERRLERQWEMLNNMIARNDS